MVQKCIDWFDHNFAGCLGFPTEIRRNQVKNFIASDAVSSSVEAEGFTEEFERDLILTKSFKLDLNQNQKKRLKKLSFNGNKIF